jgi:hypothetical protein
MTEQPLAPLSIAIAIGVMAIGSAFQASVGIGLALFVVPVLALIDQSFIPGPMLLAGVLLALLAAYRERTSIDVPALRNSSSPCPLSNPLAWRRNWFRCRPAARSLHRRKAASPHYSRHRSIQRFYASCALERTMGTKRPSDRAPLACGPRRRIVTPPCRSSSPPRSGGRCRP